MFDWQKESRERLGLVIAALSKITQDGDSWRVPSQSGRGRYVVRFEAEGARCSCPDHEETAQNCKHIYAVRYVMEREKGADGSEKLTETLTVTRVRPTYRQHWAAYNAAQVNEKREFQHLLAALCELVDEPPEPRQGRRPLPLRDMLFAAVFKVYSTLSTRRFMSDLQSAFDGGFIRSLPHFNSVINYLEKPFVTPVLRGLIETSSRPLSALETKFALDSTGFTSSRFIRWTDIKYRGGNRREHDWVKLHFMCGIHTNIVTAAEIRGRDAQDSPFLPLLLDTTARSFEVRHVLGDKAYGSVENHEAIARHGATPYIPFKSIHSGKAGGLWAQAFHYFHLHREEFLSHYHQRSNAESTVNMIKAKFRDHVRAKTDVAMVNEVLCKVLAHNICCLIQTMYELGVDFGPSPFEQRFPGPASI